MLQQSAPYELRVPHRSCLGEIRLGPSGDHDCIEQLVTDSASERTRMADVVVVHEGGELGFDGGDAQVLLR